jgi:class 3 adenylate cyclase
MFHIGINSGPMLAGNIGAADRMEYTVMGKEVNVASRLSSAAKPGQILLSDATYDAIPHTGPIQCGAWHITLRGSTAVNDVFCLNRYGTTRLYSIKGWAAARSS